MDTNIKNIGIVFGLVLIAIGILGFIPGLTPSGAIFGVFAVDMAANIVYLASGIILAGLSLSGKENTRTVLQVFAVLYVVYLILGIAQTGPVLGFIAVNLGANILHLIISLVAFSFGFGSSYRHTFNARHAS